LEVVFKKLTQYLKDILIIAMIIICNHCNTSHPIA